MKTIIKNILVFILLPLTIGFSQNKIFFKFNDGVNEKSIEKTIFQLQERYLTQNKGSNLIVKKAFKRNNIKNNISLNRIFSVEMQKKALTDSMLEYLNDQNFIEYAERSITYQVDFTPNDSLLSEQWGIAKINASKAWDKTQGSSDVVIALIDTGVDFYHPDLKNKVWVNAPEDLNNNGILDEEDINNIDDDGNGFIDDVIGWDFTDRVGFPFDTTAGDYLGWDNYPMDELFHGTFVAGIMGAETNNKIGIAGVAPESKIMILRAFDRNGSGEEDDVASAILYAVQNGASLINMSFGDTKFSFVLRDVIKYAYENGVVLVGSSGNTPTDSPHYPSGYSEVISVGNSTEGDYVAGSSSYGSTLDLVAPGSGIISTDLGGGYKTASGTSASAPFVTGAAALILSLNNSLNPDEVKQILKTTAKDIEQDGWDVKSGAGRLDLGLAVSTLVASRIKINFPTQDFTTDGNSVHINATALSAFFKKADLFYGEGITPESWTPLVENIQNQFFDENIFTLDVSSLKDTAYTIRLVAELIDGSTTEERVNFYIDRTPPEIYLGTFTPIYYGEKSTILAEIYTSERAVVKMHYRKRREAEFSTISLDGFATNNYFVKQFHYGFIPKQLVEQNEVYEIYFTAENLAGLTSELYDEGGNYFIVRTEDYFKQKEKTETLQPLPVGKLFYEPVNFLSDKKNEVLFQEFYSTDTVFYSLRKFENGAFRKIDSIKNQIPVAVGDFNKNGKSDLLSNFLRNGYIDEQKSAGVFDFENLYFNLSGKFLPVIAEDLNGDGRTEIITNDNNKIFYVYETNLSGDIISPDAPADSLPNFSRTDESNPFGNEVYINALTADCNGDGKKEIWFADADGDLIAYQVNANGYSQLDTIHTGFITTHSKTISKGDFDGDGFDDVAVLFKSNSIAPYYYLLVFNYLQNEFNILFQKVFLDQADEFADPFFTKTYQTVRLFDVDGDGANELGVAIFPYLYVFNNDGDVIDYEEGVNQETFFVGDLNGNGVPEIAIQNKSGYHFYEYDESQLLPPPNILQAFSRDSSSVYFSWNSEGTKFDIYKGTSRENLVLYDSTNAKKYEDISVENGKEYFYSVKSYSPLSAKAVFSVFVHQPARLLDAYSSTPRNVSLTFSDKINNTIERLEAFEIIGAGNPNSVAAESQFSYLLSFSEPLPEGEALVFVSGLKDFFGSPIPDDTVAFTVGKVTEEKKFFVSSYEIKDRYNFAITFNLPADSASATDFSNYNFEPENGIKKIILSEDGKTASVTAKNPIKGVGVYYAVRLSDIYSDVSEGKIKIAENSGGAIVLTGAADGVDEIYVYPNPVKLNSFEPKITFANLPENAEIIIFTIEGRVVRRIYESNGDGGESWNLTDENGETIPSGIYIYKVIQTDADGNETASKIEKFAVVK